MSAITKTPKNKIYCLDVKGQMFGSLQALESTGKRDKRHCVIWKCKCHACGDIVEQSTAQLYKNISCGCVKQERNANIRSYLHFTEGTCIEWIANRKHRNDNTSGFRGVSKTPSNKWKAGIGFKGTRHHLGTFDTFEEAVRVRLVAENNIYKPFIEAQNAIIKNANTG